MQINTINVSNALPESADKYIHLTDTHNNIVFIIDTASPKSLIPSNRYTCVTNPDPCRLFAADGHPIQQSGVIELTLYFQEFPHKQFNFCILIDTSLPHDRILIPLSLEQTIISYYHNMNHLGIKATQRFICARFFFKNMK